MVDVNQLRFYFNLIHWRYFTLSHIKQHIVSVVFVVKIIFSFELLKILHVLLLLGVCVCAGYLSCQTWRESLFFPPNIIMYQLWLLNIINGQFTIIAASIS